MGTTFVSVNDKGFWMRDGVLELWLRLLALHVEESPEEEFVGRNIRDNWLLASRGYFMGCVPDGLEDAVSTDEGRDVVIRAIRSLIDALKKGPEMLDGETLSLLGFDAGYGDFEARRLIEVGNAFLSLIAGEIQTGPGPKGFMPGMP
ncbi:MAG: hypothetical protein J2P52_10075 [Blastocatellia bacterium]|nr:hypothetical protein [Blastocatellia bacterium]